MMPARLIALGQLLFCLLIFASASAALAEPRTALVVGNGRYAATPLANPASDAQDVAAALRKAGFDVILEIDADRSRLAGALEDFGRRLKQQHGVALFYFAGHGAQIDGENYLLPVGQTVRNEADLKTGALKASDVADAMTAARTSLNIVVLDACRDNGIGSSTTRGLTRMDSGARLFVSFSTSPGAVALDGTGRNSPFTKHLIDAIQTPNIPLEEAFKLTLKGVYQETRGVQTPWISSSFFGDFIFRSTSTAATPPSPASGTQTALHSPSASRGEGTQPQLSGLYRVAGTNPNGSPYHGVAAVTQSGDQFTFKWWIGKQVFTGTGHLAGRMIVVNWGDKTPVIYDFAGESDLDGEWADGTAKERLRLYASGGAGDGVRSIEGQYRVNGTTPQGADYRGTVAISKAGDGFKVDWTIGESRYSGKGALEGNLLTVDWGSNTPVVYALMDDGTLRGLWDGGAGQEMLSPQ